MEDLVVFAALFAVTAWIFLAIQSCNQTVASDPSAEQLDQYSRFTDHTDPGKPSQ